MAYRAGHCVYTPAWTLKWYQLKNNAVLTWTKALTEAHDLEPNITIHFEYSHTSLNKGNTSREMCSKAIWSLCEHHKAYPHKLQQLLYQYTTECHGPTDLQSRVDQIVIMQLMPILCDNRLMLSSVDEYVREIIFWLPWFCNNMFSMHVNNVIRHYSSGSQLGNFPTRNICLGTFLVFTSWGSRGAYYRGGQGHWEASCDIKDHPHHKAPPYLKRQHYGGQSSGLQLRESPCSDFMRQISKLEELKTVAHENRMKL